MNRDMKFVSIYLSQIFFVLIVLTTQGKNKKRIIYGPEINRNFRYAVIKKGPDQGN